jgi:hypothetical protein
MAYTTINKSSDYFNTKLFNGTGSTLNVTGIGFQPDMVWNKARSGGNVNDHRLIDAVRGATKNIYPNSTFYEETDANGLTSFDSDGFTLGNSNGMNNSSTAYASWNWKANGAGSSNTDGSIATTVSVNTTAGFSIGTCAGLATNNDTLGHGLGVVPKMIIVKNTQATGNWFVYHASLGNTNRLYLNATDGSTTSTIWNNTTPTSSVFTMKGGDFATGESLVFYAFAEKTGYSKFGSYTGNGSSSSPTFIYTGFKPKFVIVKNTSQADSWFIHDDKRDGYNDDNEYLFADLTNAEGTNVNRIRFLSNGFSVPTTDKSHNVSGNNYIYMAFGQSLVGSNNIPCTAR